MEPKELPCWTFPLLLIVYTPLATWNFSDSPAGNMQQQALYKNKMKQSIEKKNKR